MSAEPRTLAHVADDHDDDWIRKPFSAHDLISRVSAILGRR